MMSLISEKRGNVDHRETLDAKRVMLTSLIPLNEILIDFHDRIKSITRGFGSMDYEPADYQESDMVKLDMLVNTEAMDAFSCIVHPHARRRAGRGRALAEKLKEVIPAPAISNQDPGGHRRKNCRLGSHQCVPQGRDGEVLWRRRLPETQAAGETERGQKTDDIHWSCEQSAGSLHRSPQSLSHDK